MPSISIQPRGPFDLAAAREFAGGFPAGIGAQAAGDGSILMAFPVENSSGSAVVQLTEAADGWSHEQVEAALEHERSGKARKGALAALEAALEDK